MLLSALEHSPAPASPPRSKLTCRMRSATTASLKSTTAGKHSALASPWWIPAWLDKGCASEWQAPKPFWKATAAIIAAFIIAPRAFMLAPSATARPKFSLIRSIAATARRHLPWGDLQRPGRPRRHGSGRRNPSARSSAKAARELIRDPKALPLASSAERKPLS